jgi:hypothetical protein
MELPFCDFSGAIATLIVVGSTVIAVVILASCLIAWVRRGCKRD